MRMESPWAAATAPPAPLGETPRGKWTHTKLRTTPPVAPPGGGRRRCGGRRSCGQSPRTSPCRCGRAAPAEGRWWRPTSRRFHGFKFLLEGPWSPWFLMVRRTTPLGVIWTDWFGRLDGLVNFGELHLPNLSRNNVGLYGQEMQGKILEGVKTLLSYVHWASTQPWRPSPLLLLDSAPSQASQEETTNDEE
ncbi:hypothetical protein PVAP13_9KG423083 [Panicum virgatum]|uniref:Uncharacterized protein n=1 Tax=Panicum virgatum TaxID=38727 RepID=A0A8T0N8L5_PANVG|nr:hypothetical protein PVAP13_9KG423083 [Panicum virgatum]